MSAKPRLSPPLSIADVSEMFGGKAKGWDYHHTRRWLLKLNDEVHGTLLVNRGGKGNGARWELTLAKLMAVAPYLFASTPVLAAEVQAVREGLRDISAFARNTDYVLSRHLRDHSEKKPGPGIRKAG